MRNTFMGLLIVFLFAVTGETLAQARDTTDAGRYEYAMIALDEPSLAGAPRIRIYYGNGNVEAFGKGSLWRAGKARSGTWT